MIYMCLRVFTYFCIILFHIFRELRHCGMNSCGNCEERTHLRAKNWSSWRCMFLIHCRWFIFPFFTGILSSVRYSLCQILFMLNIFCAGFFLIFLDFFFRFLSYLPAYFFTFYRSTFFCALTCFDTYFSLLVYITEQSNNAGRVGGGNLTSQLWGPEAEGVHSTSASFASTFGQRPSSELRLRIVSSLLSPCRWWLVIENRMRPLFAPFLGKIPRCDWELNAILPIQKFPHNS